MWRQTLLLRLMAPSALCLRVAGRPSHTSSSSSSSKRGAQKKGSATTAASPLPSAAPVNTLTPPPLPSVSEDPRASEFTGAADVSASSAAPPSPSSPSSSSSLVNAVEHLREMTRRTQHTLRAHEESLQLLQQKFALMERQVGQLESTAEGLRGKLNEVHRAVGEVVMGQRNTDLLIQQMERQQLNIKPAATSETQRDPSKPLSQMPTTTTTTATATTTTTTAPEAVPKTASSAADNSLARQVALLDARINQLTLELFSADRLLAAGEGRDTSAAAKKLAALLASPSRAAKRATLIQWLHQQHAVDVFTDAAGVTRVSSQCVCLHNVPLNLGATEVRELCVQHVCKGDENGLVSCVVRRSPQLLPSGPQSSAPPPSAPTAERSASRSQSYPSQQRTAAAPVVGALPRGDDVADVRPNTKSFEIVFASSALALEALKTLNGLQLRPTAHADPIPLAVEPVVSADVLTALHEMEAAASTPAGSNEQRSV